MWRALLVLVLALLAVPAAAHDSGTGWDYDRDCCSGRDCAPVLDDRDVTETAQGWRLDIQPEHHPSVALIGIPFRELVPHGDRRLRHSPDGRVHACILGTQLLCLYVPSRAT